MLKFILLFAALAAAVLASNSFKLRCPLKPQFRPLRKPNIPVTFSSIVHTEGGQIQGTIESSGILSRYSSFKGIPYAEPPVGNLRFRAPVPHSGWEGVRDGSNHGESCPSDGWLSDKTGDEDCLFLNVYSPNLIGKRPVMVWIHGGSFTGGSGDSFIYGPDHLVNSDVVVVTINYRLGILGFFSTGDRHAPGNYGMKDMVLALKWVKNNIINFGGDPDNVTIFGESAGGVAIHYLVLSPLANGLFEKAISQSGSALSPWGFQTDPRSQAINLAADLNITFTSTEDLVSRLRTVPAVDFVINTPGWLALDIPRGLVSFAYAPSIDAADSEEEIFLHQHPMQIMESGTFNHVPFVIGYNDAESLFMIHEQLLDPSVADVINDNPELLVPPTWNIDPSSPAGIEISESIRKFYLDDEPLSSENILDWTKFNTDVHFAVGVDTVAQLHASGQTEPVYYYVFSFDGDLNLVKRLLILSRFPGAMHADELPYLFSMTRLPPPLLPSNHALTVRRRMVRMWTDFARVGQPTPTIDSLIEAQWQPIDSNQEYFNIGDNLVAGTFPVKERMTFWNDLQNRFTKKI